MNYKIAFTTDRGSKDYLANRYRIVLVNLSISQPTTEDLIIKQAHRILRAKLNKTEEGKKVKICKEGYIHN